VLDTFSSNALHLGIFLFFFLEYAKLYLSGSMTSRCCHVRVGPQTFADASVANRVGLLEI
jgi:hypothetical protein